MLLAVGIILLLGFLTWVANARSPAKVPPVEETELARIYRLRRQLKCKRLREEAFKHRGNP